MKTIAVSDAIYDALEDRIDVDNPTHSDVIGALMDFVEELISQNEKYKNRGRNEIPKIEE